jgi:hypothetical protein
MNHDRRHAANYSLSFADANLRFVGARDGPMLSGGFAHAGSTTSTIDRLTGARSPQVRVVGCRELRLDAGGGNAE